MIIKNYYSLLLLFVAFKSKGQPLGDINTYLRNPKIPEAAKLYYAGKLTAHDDSTTYSIIDSIHTKNATTRPFYLLLISKMIRESDGALSEGLYEDCLHFFYKKPNELIAFLYDKNQKDRFKTDWAYAIAQELDLSDKIDKKHLKEAVFSKCKIENRNNLKAFWIKVEHEIH